MDLQRELAVRVEKFDQQRKLSLGRMATQQCGPVAGDQLRQGRAGQRPGGHAGLIGAVIGDFPTLGVIVASAQRFA